MDDLQEFLSEISNPAGHQQPSTPAPPPLTRPASEIQAPTPSPQPASPDLPPAAPSPYARRREPVVPGAAERAAAYARPGIKGQEYARPSEKQAKPTRASRWTEALKDRSNLRNIIIAKEIIGRPIGLRPD